MRMAPWQPLAMILAGGMSRQHRQVGICFRTSVSRQSIVSAASWDAPASMSRRIARRCLCALAKLKIQNKKNVDR